MIVLGGLGFFLITALFLWWNIRLGVLIVEQMKEEDADRRCNLREG